MSTIGNKTIEGASELVSGLLHTYFAKVEQRNCLVCQEARRVLNEIEITEVAT